MKKINVLLMTSFKPNSLSILFLIVTLVSAIRFERKLLTFFNIISYEAFIVLLQISQIFPLNSNYWLNVLVYFIGYALLLLL